MAETLQCTLVTPSAQLLDEEITYASVPAWDGLIGIAPMRAPLLIKLEDGPLRLDFTQGGSRWFFVGGGFAQMQGNHLSLLTSEAVPGEDIVLRDAEGMLQEATGLEAVSDEDVLRKHRQVTRARALIGLAQRLGNKI